MTSPFIVIGTGISELGAIEALIEKGHKPLVVDIGLIPKITKIELESNRILAQNLGRDLIKAMD